MPLHYTCARVLSKDAWIRTYNVPYIINIRSTCGPLLPAGGHEQRFGKILGKMIFLRELSRDGAVRSVRGAFSAALAARENGLTAMAVPETNPRAGVIRRKRLQ